MKNVLVTGGCGFIGTNFIRFLLSAPDFRGRIINVDKLTYAGNIENLRGIGTQFPGSYHLVRGDICNPKVIAKVIERFEIDTICHFAAESHVDRSIAEPDAFIKTNITGTFNLLELFRAYQHRINLFHHISTDEVYGSLDEDGFFTEDTPYNPSSPYSASKAASDHLVRAYGKTYNLPVTLSNCSNNYGPYQFPEKLIPLTILNAIEGKKLPVYGDGLHVRDWLFVTDHCKAIWAIMKRGKRGGSYNIGGNCAMTNIDVVTMICDMLDEMAAAVGNQPRRNLITLVKDRPGHDRRYAIDNTKIRATLGWTPEESFETGLIKTIKWYLSNEKWANRIKTGEYKAWIEKQYKKTG
jgi:dTDP-glucose 4,6-dehydratase